MKNIKVLLSLVIFTISQTVFAANNTLSDFRPGFYLGAQVGYASLDEGSGFEDAIKYEYNDVTSNNKFYEVSKDINTAGIGGRGFLGYSFTPYFSLEAGYSLFPDNGYRYEEEYPNIKDISINTEAYSIDLVGKAIFPLEKMSPAFAGWGIYAKLGVAYTYSTYQRVDKLSWPDTITMTTSAIRPAYGAGISYNFTDKFAVDFSWTGTYGKNFVTEEDISFTSKIQAIPTTNLFAFGISYKFSWADLTQAN